MIPGMCPLCGTQFPDVLIALDLGAVKQPWGRWTARGAQGRVYPAGAICCTEHHPKVIGYSGLECTSCGHPASIFLYADDSSVHFGCIWCADNDAVNARAVVVVHPGGFRA